MWGTFDLVVFKVILRSFGVLVSKYTMKMACQRVKWIAILQPGLLEGHMWSVFHQVVLYVILGSFSALVSK